MVHTIPWCILGCLSFVIVFKIFFTMIKKKLGLLLFSICGVTDNIYSYFNGNKDLITIQYLLNKFECAEISFFIVSMTERIDKSKEEK